MQKKNVLENRKSNNIQSQFSYENFTYFQLLFMRQRCNSIVVVFVSYKMIELKRIQFRFWWFSTLSRGMNRKFVKFHEIQTDWCIEFNFDQFCIACDYSFTFWQSCARCNFTSNENVQLNCVFYSEWDVCVTRCRLCFICFCFSLTLNQLNAQEDVCICLHLCSTSWCTNSQSGTHKRTHRHFRFHVEFKSLFDTCRSK